ncbi:MAG: hypothetical protein RLZZ507_1226 [Cyanobacteriota bacterium]
MDRATGSGPVGRGFESLRARFFNKNHKRESNTVRLRVFVGWVEQSETQQTLVNVGFPIVNPTYIMIFFGLNRKVLKEKVDFFSLHLILSLIQLVRGKLRINSFYFCL